MGVLPGRCPTTWGSPAAPPLQHGVGGVLQCKDLLLLRWWKNQEHKITLLIQVILAAIVDDAYQLISGCFRIRNNSIDLAGNQGRPVVGVVDTKGERVGFRPCFHQSSK